MAVIYTKCGQYDKALDELEVLLSELTGYSVNSIKMSSHFDPLRDLPRYQEMVRKYGSASSLP